MSQPKVPGVVNRFNVLKIGKPQGLPHIQPLWPQGDMVSPRDLERDADLQEIYREARQLESRLRAETQRRRHYQVVASAALAIGAGLFVFFSVPPALSALRAWAIATIPAPPEPLATDSQASVPLASIPQASVSAVLEAMTRSALPRPVPMDASMAGVPAPPPTVIAQQSRTAELPYKPPTSQPSTARPIARQDQTAAQRPAPSNALEVEPVGKVRPASVSPARIAPAQPVQPAQSAATRSPQTSGAASAAASTIAPRFIESAPIIQGFIGSSGALISFGDGGAVRTYRLNDVLTPGENITAITPATGEITTTRRTIRK